MWKEIPELYEVAKKVTNDAGMPWTDPRTGKTYAPPKKRKAQKKRGRKK